MRLLRSKWRLIAILLTMLLGLAACGRPEAETVSPAAEATIEFLRTENERLRSELATPGEPDSSAEDGDLLGAMVAQSSSEEASEDEMAAAAEAGQSPLANPTAAPTAEPTATLTPLPPPTPLPAFVPEPLDEAPPETRFAPDVRFAALWENAPPARGQAFGWALEDNASVVSMVAQPFERGVMLWRADTRTIYALWDEEEGPRWRAFEDTFQEGEPESDPALTPPESFRQPERGFGKIWRQNPDVRAALGWALAREGGSEAYVQPFERGLMISTGARVYAMGQTPEGETVWFSE